MAALIDGINQDLGKDVREISVYSLNSALDTAVRASSAQYDDPDTIARLQIRLEESIGTETGRPRSADMIFQTVAWLLACMVSKALPACQARHSAGPK